MDRERGRRKQKEPMVFGRMRRTLRRLRQDEPTPASPLEKRRIAPDFHRDPDACQECHRMPCVCDVRPLIGGPLGEGD